MSGSERDAEFEAFLRQRSVLSRGQRVARQLEPPEVLDDIVLTQARQAIQSGKQPPLYRAPRWALPVALAATLLLSMSIVLNVSLNARKQTQTSQEAPLAKTESSREPGPTLSADQTERAAPRVTAADAQRATDSAPAVAASEPPAAPPERRALSGGSLSAAPAARSASATAGATPPNMPGYPSLDEFAAKAGLEKDPRAWLQWITALRAQGRTSAADAQLGRFRAAYPDYPVPASAAGSAPSATEPGPAMLPAPSAPSAPR